MTEIYIIRHAQAEGNLYRMMQGNWDGDVTPLGLRQIDALAERFRHVKIDALYSSDLYRTRVTASAITRWHSIPMQLDARLREIHMGSWETEFFGNLEYRCPEKLHEFIFEPDRFSLDGAETYAQVARRASEALREIAANNPDRTVAVVSHGVAIRCMLSEVLGIPIGDTEHLPIPSNTGVVHLFYDKGSFTADYINDFSHLTPELAARPGNQISLRHEYIDPAEHKDYYISCYSDAWLAAHGDLRGFVPETYYAAAVSHHADDHRAVSIIYNKDEPVGLIDMDTRRGAHAQYGWISLLYLREDFRGRGYGIQLLARPLRDYADMQRNALRLLVSSDNERALKFYKRCGFRQLSTQPGASGELLLMERKLEGARDARV